jgi:hypothetical protein
MIGIVAGATGLEPATSGVTGRRSNQLSYAPAWGQQELETPPAIVKEAGRPTFAKIVRDQRSAPISFRPHTHRNERAIRSARHDTTRDGIFAQDGRGMTTRPAIGDEQKLVHIAGRRAGSDGAIHANDPGLRGRARWPRRALQALRARRPGGTCDALGTRRTCRSGVAFGSLSGRTVAADQRQEQDSGNQ